MTFDSLYATLLSVMGLDVIIFIIVFASIIYGLIKGALREIFALAGIIVGIIAAAKFFKTFALMLPISNPNVALVVSFIIIFLIIAVAINIIGWLILRTMQLLQAGFVDRLLGVILGFIKGTLISGLICLLLTLFPTGRNIVSNSMLAPVLFQEMLWVKGLLPKDLQKRLKWKTPKEESVSYEKEAASFFIDIYGINS